MKHRSIRVDDATWEAAIKRSRREGIPLGIVIRRFLAHYGKDEQV